MKNKILRVFIISVIVGMIISLSACDSLKSNENSQSQVDDFNILLHKNIIDVEVDYIGYSDDIDIQWLEEALLASELADTPEDIIALELHVTVYYDNSTTSTLRLLDPTNNICSIRYNEVSYAFQNKAISDWMDSIT